MRRPFVAAAIAAVSLAVPVAASAHLDHPIPTSTFPSSMPLSSNFNAGGEGAKWELLSSIPTSNAQSDLDFFTRDGETFASVGSLGVNLNGGGQNIIKLTEGGKVGRGTARPVANQPSAACPANPANSLGLQHDVEAVPKGTSQQGLLNTNVPSASLGDAQVLLDATDSTGRCHDQGTLGVSSAPQGGIEIIDVTDPSKPKEIGLTSHVGQSHTVNVDPRRPHIAYSITSDQVNVDAKGERANEKDGTNATGQVVPSRVLDGFEIIDMRSCLAAPLGDLPSGLTIAQKRDLCKPKVFRYRYPSAAIALGHSNQGAIFGCHETEVYPDDTLTCAGGAAAIVFDLKKMFDDNGTPTNFNDDKVRGNPLPCRLRDSSSQGQGLKTMAKVTDCVIGQDPAKPNDPAATVDLGVPGWKAIGSPSAEGIEHRGSVFHQGRELSQDGAVRPDQPATEDIDFNHETEFTESRNLLISSDERGGGVLGGAQCSPGADLSFANGGLHFYRTDRLTKTTPAGATNAERSAQAFEAYARDSKGKKSIYRAPIRTGPQGSFCTVHVFQQIPGENRIFMGYYSQGTRVLDFTENADGTVDFKEAGFFIPEGANQWVSSVFKKENNPDGTTTYFGATGDGIVGASGRNGIDVYKVTLPPAPKPGRGANPTPPPAPAPKPGVTPGTPPKQPTTPPTQCAATSGFTTVGATRRGRGANLSFTRRTQNPVTVDVFRQSVGRRVIGERLVARFSNRSSSVRWNGKANRGRKGALGDGYYFVRYRMKTSQGTDTRRVVLRRSKGRFTRQTDFFRRGSCDLLTRFKLERPVFGGTRRAAPLGISYQLARDSRVTVTVLRGTKVVKRFPARSATAKRLVRLRLSGKGLPRGEYRVRLSAREASGASVSSTLASQKL